MNGEYAKPSLRKLRTAAERATRGEVMPVNWPAGIPPFYPFEDINLSNLLGRPMVRPGREGSLRRNKTHALDHRWEARFRPSVESYDPEESGSGPRTRTTTVAAREEPEATRDPPNWLQPDPRGWPVCCRA